MPIIKAREPARILTSTGKKQTDGCHLELKYRWVDQYNFYLNDSITKTSPAVAT